MSDPTETSADAAYVAGWNHCMAGNDVRFGNPHYEVNQELADAWYAGALDAMEADDDEEPEPECAGYGPA